MGSRILVLCALVLFSGCASTTGSVRPTLSAPAPSLERFRHLEVSVEVNGDVPANVDAQQRILGLILENVRKAGRFQPLQPESSRLETLKAKVVLTRYDEGNAFARYMLAGLGSMHIDAEVTLTPSETNQSVLARYEVSKTFAWGGIYGAATTIRDIEDGFAKAVAVSITGKR